MQAACHTHRHPPDRATRPLGAPLVRELLLSVCTKASGNFLPPPSRSQQKVTAMNLGLETALTPAGSMDASSMASATPGANGVAGAGVANGAPGAPVALGKANPAAAVFGQLMAKALQQQAQSQGQGVATGTAIEQTPGTPGEPAEGATLLAVFGTPDAADTSGKEGAEPADKPAGSADAALVQYPGLLGMPPWMHPPGGLSAVQHITVGPSLQAITGATPPPDAHSLTAFARQQGLDTAAIAWLMNPSMRGGSDQPLPGTGVATTPLTPTPPPWNTALASAQGAPMPLPAGLAGTLAPGASTLAASPNAWPTVAGSAGPNSLSTGALALFPTPAISALPSPGATQAAGAASASPLLGATGAYAPADPSAPVALTVVSAAGRQDGPPALGGAFGDMGQLRWNQALAAAQANPQNPAGAGVNLPATSTAWTAISLDLSSDAGDAADPQSPEDSANPGALGHASGPAPIAADGQGLHKAQALAFQARLAAQAGMASSLGTGSDQMQQLSEKMADAIGERMLQELEKGQFNLRLSLKPAHLGHIEVEMRLRAGELDATFAAPQAATRELLQDGLARLRDSLAQAGMDVANLNVKNGQNRQNGGDSTAEHRKSAPKAQPSEAADSSVASVESAPRPRRSDGWDVMV